MKTRCRALSHSVVATLMACAATTYGQTVTVYSLSDSGPGTLRQAVVDVAPGGTIVFDAALTPGTVVLSTGELLIDRDLTITGPGADRMAISGNHTSRVFHIAAGVNVEIHALAIEDGSTSGEAELDGGAILNFGALTLSHCIVRNSRAGDGLDDQASTFAGQGGNGGGIATQSSGSLQILHTTVAGNRAGDGGNSALAAGNGGQGGGIYAVGPMVMKHSTVSLNEAGDPGTGPAPIVVMNGDGGGIFAFSPVIENSTVSGNSSGWDGVHVTGVGYGGGVLLRGGTVNNSTITMNLRGGGLATFPFWLDPITVTSSIVAGNTFWECIDQVGGVIQSAGYNATTTGGDCPFSEPTDVPASPGDVFSSLMDSTLQANGGPTQTHALLNGSAAVDAGSCAGMDSDQRGYGGSPTGPRIVDLPDANADDGCDIGAVELQGVPIDLIVYFSRPGGWGYPHIQYFDTGPDIGATGFPGEPTLHEGCGWYRWRFEGASMAHMLFNGFDTPQTPELFRSSQGWFDAVKNTWSDVNPDPPCTDTVRVAPRALLEGPYAGTGTMTHSLQNAGEIPATQPYGGAEFSGTPLKHHGEETSTEMGGGGSLSVTDWSIVELRSDRTADTKVAARAAIHSTDGNLIDPITLGQVEFPGVAPGPYYVVVRHRNHLPIMSRFTVSLSAAGTPYDFTASASKSYGTNPVKRMSDGRGYAMWAADADADGGIQAQDFNAYVGETTSGAWGYQTADFNLSGYVQALDFNLYITNKVVGASSQVPD